MTTGGLDTCSCGISMLVRMGKWSVVVGCSEGSTSHLVMRLAILPVQKRLSGLEYLFVTMCCRVGIPFGSGILRLKVASCLIKPSAALVA